MTLNAKFLGAFFILLAPAFGYALSPIVQFQDLVAGEGEPGFEDGPFYSAQFNRPLGLALNSDGSVLYAADQQNNRIRAVDLDQKNTVSTLAGTGIEGKGDGPLTVATFNQPVGLAFLPNDQIAVNDLGNGLIRLIDLKARMVSTLAGGGSAGFAEGEALKVQLGALWNMVYFPSDQCLYFSQPELGTLQKLDLKTRVIETVLKNSSLVPEPAALCVADGKLYMADRKLGKIYEILPGDKKKAPVITRVAVQTSTPGVTQITSISLQSVGEAQKVLALAGSGKALYAYQADPKAPLSRVFPDSAPLTFASVWGDRLINPDPGTLFPQFKYVISTDRVGFIENSRSEGSFYVANPTCSIISSFRDLRMSTHDFDQGEDRYNSAGIHEFEYPYKKPAKTFRILLIGRSYIYWTANDHQFEQKGLEAEQSNLMTTLAKHMELNLNTRAALEDAPRHYEVINGGMHSGSNELNIWPYYVVPGLAQKYDIDLVLIMCDGYLGLDSFFRSPLTPEGIPGKDVDPEYVLKPNSEKFKEGPLHDFFELCLAKKFLDVHSNTLWVPNVDGMILDPEMEDRLIDISGKPLKLLQKKMESMKTSEGNPRRLELCLFSLVNFPMKSRRKFWGDFCFRVGIPYIDLCDSFNALGLTYFPYAAGHFTVNGMNFFSEIVVNELLKNKKIPFKPTTP